jgi:hypothetical protein
MAAAKALAAIFADAWLLDGVRTPFIDITAPSPRFPRSTSASRPREPSSSAPGCSPPTSAP